MKKKMGPAGGIVRSKPLQIILKGLFPENQSKLGGRRTFTYKSSKKKKGGFGQWGHEKIQKGRDTREKSGRKNPI